jgi:two-component system sensor histidine kinase/response regulator
MRDDHKKILIIDDEAVICSSCTQVLVEDGYRVESTQTGQAGVEKYRAAPFDVVFLDLKMPGMSGMEVLENLRSIDKNVIAVVITGYATIESAVESIKKGAFDFLPKPFTPDELRVIARRAFEQKRLLVETEKLRHEKERMREQFVSMVSHQLKVPLVAVQQYFEVILGGLAGDINDQQKQMIERSHKRIGELLKLIDDWLSFSRIDKERIAPQFSEFDLVELIKGTIEFLKPLADEKKVKLVLENRDSRMITAHKDFIREALTNLINNAIIYNKEDGKVVVKVSTDQNKVLIEISDTGIGIEKDVLPNIFDEFYRDKRVKLTLGSGLGLSIVKRIIEAHDGVIEVQSTVDTGSVFTIELPSSLSYSDVRSDHKGAA